MLCDAKNDAGQRAFRLSGAAHLGGAPVVLRVVERKLEPGATLEVHWPHLAQLDVGTRDLKSGEARGTDASRQATVTLGN